MNEIYHVNLESERLITRKLNKADIPVWADFFKDPASVEYIPMKAKSSDTEKAEQWIERQFTRYNENRGGLIALIDKKSGNFIGQCGLLTQEVDGIQEIEVGYHIMKQYRGKAYAPEAARLFMDYAFNQKLTDNIISIIDIRNFNSQRVAEKNGFKKEKQTRWKDIDIFVYRINKQKWNDNKVTL